jgi:nitrogen fixation protein NifU and related proteins
MNNDPLYQENILEHFHHPRNKGKMEVFDIKYKGENPSCGDDITLYIKWDEAHEQIADISFSGFGCAISQSGASMLTDKVKGMSGKDIERLDDAYMYALYGVEVSPQREKCALLAVRTLKEAIGV